MLFYAMSRRRVSCPQMTQQLWDAVKTIRYQRQTPDVDRIAKYMSRVHNVGLEEVNRQLNYCVRDGLLHMTKRVCNKGSKVGAEIESYNLPGDEVDKDSHDWYCFECHRGGDVISCNSCHRVYHLACIEKEQLPETDVKHKFVCNVCKTISEEAMDIKKSHLNRLLRLTLRRLKHWLPMSLTERNVICNASASPFIHERQTSRRNNSELPSTIKWVNDDKDPWRLEFLLYRQIDLQFMGAKAEKNQYENIGEFRADAQTIVHNVVIYHGVNSVVADHARLMLRNCITDLQELKQCRDCYKVSFKVTNRHWFCKPCRPPHTLIYAKQKGFPYWPAKVMNIDGDQYDVRFFGATHERAVVDKAFIRPISMNINSLQVKKTSAWTKACEELKKHRERLEKLRLVTNDFTEPSPDSSSDSSDDESVVEPSPTAKVESPVEKPVKPMVAVESDISDYSDDEEAPLLKRLKREETEDSSSLPEPDLEVATKIPLAPTKTGAMAKQKSPPQSLISGEITTPVKRRPGRPAKSVSPLKPTVRKKIIRKVKILASLKPGGRRGRPPGTKNRTFILKQQMIEMQRKLEKEFEEKKKKRDEENKRQSEQGEEKDDDENVGITGIKVEPELASPQLKVETEISSTSIPSLPCKKEEEEMVSSSCQEPQVRSVAVQTKPSSPAPPSPPPSPSETQRPVVEEPPVIDIDKIREEVIAEKDKEIERLTAGHIAELAVIEEKHKLIVTEIKKKQWGGH